MATTAVPTTTNSERLDVDDNRRYAVSVRCTADPTAGPPPQWSLAVDGAATVAADWHEGYWETWQAEETGVVVAVSPTLQTMAAITAGDVRVLRIHSIAGTEAVEAVATIRFY